MRIFFFLLALLCLELLNGQPTKVLKIGDTVPNYRLSPIINAPFTSASLADFKDKWLILDFFATWCGPCVSSLPRLDSLQRVFGKDLQIIVMDSYDPPEITMAFLAKNKSFPPGGLPFVLSDTVINHWFPHTMIPHEVWIKNGVVKAITSAQEVTMDHIRKLIAGEGSVLRTKSDRMDFNKDQSLLLTQASSEILVSSVLTRYLKGVGSRSGKSTDKRRNTIRYYYINSPLLDLYQHAIKHKIPDNFVVLETSDSSLFFQGELDFTEWSERKHLCYEDTYPITAPDSLVHQKMVADLNQVFELEAVIETRNMPCYVLQQSAGNTLQLTTKGGTPSTVFDKKSPVKSIRNTTLSKLVKSMNTQLSGRPLVPIILDETRLTHPVDLQFQVPDIQDLSAMQKAFSNYGLQLIPTTRFIRVLVIRDRSPIQIPKQQP
jgi:thiol-disulfide isomerase/thioredoxin